MKPVKQEKQETRKKLVNMTKAVLQNITGYYTLFKRLRRLIISAYYKRPLY